MLAYLKGQILKKTTKGIILKTGDVGYFVHLGAKFTPLLNENEEVELFIHHQIKEDASDLYGFTKYQDLEFFTKLLSINGVGPKVAMEILSADTEQVKSAIVHEDEKFLSKLPGIGPKMAKRIILEMKDKIEKEGILPHETSATEEFHSDAFEALLKLGYHRQQITRTLKTLPKEITVAEEIITYFLKNA